MAAFVLEGDKTFYRAKIATARFYADPMLPQVAAWVETVRNSGYGKVMVTKVIVVCPDFLRFSAIF